MDTLIKQPNEAILFDMNLLGLGSLSRGDTISNVVSVVADVAGLTISDIAHDSKTIAQFRIAGGTSGTDYKITALVNTLSGDTLEGEGLLRVVDL